MACSKALVLLKAQSLGVLLVNKVTWPEFAHQYLVIFIEIKKSGDLSGLTLEECKRFIRCLQRDGGVLFGIVIIIVVKGDAQVCWSYPGSNWYACFFLENKKIVLPHTFVSPMDLFLCKILGFQNINVFVFAKVACEICYRQPYAYLKIIQIDA